MRTTDQLPIGLVARRAGLATSALRYYERQGLISSVRTSGGVRRYPRSVLRRLAFIRAAQSVGLSLDEVHAALSTLPDRRNPASAEWARLSRSWQARLDEQIDGLVALRDRLGYASAAAAFRWAGARCQIPMTRLARQAQEPPSRSRFPG